MKKLKIIIPVFLIIIITLAVFYPALKNNFTNWDDNLYVTANSSIRNVSWINLKTISTSFFVTHYQPVTIFSYLLEYHFFRLNPFNYHLDNLILHLFNCLLVFWVIYLLTGRIALASLTALFFGIHPMQVESVCWISERKNLLYAFFYLGAIISYLYYLRKDKALKYFFFCLGLFILSLLSKSMAITLPLTLLLLDYFTSRKINLAVLLEKMPCFCLSVVFGLIALWGSYLSTPFYKASSYSLLTKLMGISGDVVFYLNKLILPIKLSVLYPYSKINYSLLYLYPLIIVIILLTVVIASSRYTKKVIFGSGLFLLITFPVIRFLPLNEIIVADRYVYLSAIGIFYLIAEGCLWLYTRKIKYSRLVRVFLISALVVVAILLGYSTWKRSQAWKDSLSLWGDVLDKYPDAATAYNNRGEFFMSQAEYSKALANFILAINARTKYPYNPEYKYYYLNLGNALRALGREQEAIAVFEKLIKETEAYFSLSNIKDLIGNDKVTAANRKALEAGAYFNLGNIKDSHGDKNKAMELYIKAIELDPRMLYAHDYLGALYLNLKRLPEAQRELAKVIEIDPTYLSAYIKLAQVYKILGQEKNLEQLYKKAIVNNLDFFEAYYYAGNLSVNAQKDEDAILFYRKAIEISPGSPEACVGLGNAYLTIGKNKAAIICLKKALELDPSLAVAHNNLALAYYYNGEYALAIQHSNQASKLGYAISPKLQELLKPYRK